MLTSEMRSAPMTTSSTGWPAGGRQARGVGEIRGERGQRLRIAARAVGLAVEAKEEVLEQDRRELGVELLELFDGRRWRRRQDLDAVPVGGRVDARIALDPDVADHDQDQERHADLRDLEE